MKITAGLYHLALVVVFITIAGCATSQPKLTLEEILDQYPQVASLDSSVKEAQSKGAEYLAPESYNAALNSLESAMNAAHNNNKQDANKAAAKGQKVIARLNLDTESSRKILSEVLNARERALAAGAQSLKGDALADMDKELKSTAALVEEGNVERAKQRRPQLVKGYAQLELNALKQGTAELAKSAIANAKQHGAEKYAPKTLAQAEEEMALAVTILETDRTQKSKADAQANKAKWLAEKSAAITETVKDFDRRDYTMEEVVLWHQAQLSTVNEPLGRQLPFNESSDKVVQNLRNSVSIAVSESDVARSELTAAEDNYGKQLALTQKERLILQQKAREDRLKFDNVQAMFTSKEANVYRQREDVLISAYGFQFPSGGSEITAANFPLMNKIIRAIKIFPDASIELAGHTDSTGAEAINQKLSQARAEKVGKFLTEVGEIPSNRITARGYGLSRPVASNKTAAGRAENRRVEIKIVNE